MQSKTKTVAIYEACKGAVPIYIQSEKIIQAIGGHSGHACDSSELKVVDKERLVDTDEPTQTDIVCDILRDFMR